MSIWNVLTNQKPNNDIIPKNVKPPKFGTFGNANYIDEIENILQTSNFTLSDQTFYLQESGFTLSYGEYDNKSFIFVVDNNFNLIKLLTNYEVYSQFNEATQQFDIYYEDFKLITKLEVNPVGWIHILTTLNNEPRVLTIWNSFATQKQNSDDYIFKMVKDEPITLGNIIPNNLKYWDIKCDKNNLGNDFSIMAYQANPDNNDVSGPIYFFNCEFQTAYGKQSIWKNQKTSSVFINLSKISFERFGLKLRFWLYAEDGKIVKLIDENGTMTQSNSDLQNRLRQMSIAKNLFPDKFTLTTFKLKNRSATSPTFSGIEFQPGTYSAGTVIELRIDGSTTNKWQCGFARSEQHPWASEQITNGANNPSTWTTLSEDTLNSLLHDNISIEFFTRNEQGGHATFVNFTLEYNYKYANIINIPNELLIYWGEISESDIPTNIIIDDNGEIKPDNSNLIFGIGNVIKIDDPLLEGVQRIWIPFIKSGTAGNWQVKLFTIFDDNTFEEVNIAQPDNFDFRGGTFKLGVSKDGTSTNIVYFIYWVDQATGAIPYYAGHWFRGDTNNYDSITYSRGDWEDKYPPKFTNITVKEENLTIILLARLNKKEIDFITLNYNYSSGYFGDVYDNTSDSVKTQRLHFIDKTRNKDLLTASNNINEISYSSNTVTYQTLFKTNNILIGNINEYELIAMNDSILFNDEFNFSKSIFETLIFNVNVIYSGNFEDKTIYNNIVDVIQSPNDLNNDTNHHIININKVRFYDANNYITEYEISSGQFLNTDSVWQIILTWIYE